MKYPTLRYGNPNELQYYAQFIPLPELAKRLRRTERSVRDWTSGRKKVPWWVPEIIRLQKMENDAMLYQMGMKPVMARLGIVTPEAALIPFTRVEKKTEPKPGLQSTEVAETFEDQRMRA